MIHTFGESHSVYGWNKCKNVITHSIGPVLAYSLGRDKLQRLNIKNFNIKDNDSVVFCFGEIDCRCHIHKYITKDNTYKMIIDNIVNNYVDAINLNINNCDTKLNKIAIYNVVPPVEDNYIKTWEGDELLNAVKKWPFLGTDIERQVYVKYFNNCLEKKCLLNNWIFVNIYDFYADKNGFLNKSLSDGLVHIDNPIFLQKFIDIHLI